MTVGTLKWKQEGQKLRKQLQRLETSSTVTNAVKQRGDRKHTMM